MKHILHTERLVLRELTTADAAFILELLNTPSWLQYIGDRGVKTLADAEHYLVNGPMKSYETNGFGLWAMELKENAGTPIGLCGLIKRAGLEDVDIGFAMLPAYEGKGYGYEVAVATMSYAWSQLRLKRVVAITSLDNTRSIKLLEKTGFRLEKTIQLPGDSETLNLFASEPE